MSLMCADELELVCSCSVPFHTYGLLFVLLVEAIRGQCVFYGCERSHNDGSSLRSPRGACWSSFKRVVLYNHSKSTQMAPRAVRGFADGELRCRHIYFPEGDAILTCSDGFFNELYIGFVEELSVCRVEY